MSQTSEQFNFNNIEEDLSEEQVNQFDWHSRSLTFDNCHEKIGNDLMKVLVLPTIDDFLPYLAQCDFPDYLIQYPEVWKSVFAEFTPLYERAIDEFYQWRKNSSEQPRSRVIQAYQSSPELEEEMYRYLWTLERGYTVVRFDVDRKAWRKVLEMLTDRAGKQVAIELERWVYRHYISERYTEAMSQWWSVFDGAPTIPDFLAPIMSEIYRQISYEDLSRVSEETESLNYKYHDECDRDYPERESIIHDTQEEYESYCYMNEHHPPYFANYFSIKESFVNVRVTALFQLLARSLSSDQIQQVVEWAELYEQNKQCPSDPKKLCGSEFITTKNLFYDFTSVLDMNL